MNQENAVSDSWEDIDETELEKRLDQEKQERTRKEQEMTTAKQNSLSLLSNGGDDFKPRILQRPKPTVTILKRPDSSPALSSASQNQKPQIKTLEQREKEYAEARLRILGSAASSESSLEQNKQFIANPKLSPSSSSNFLPAQSHQQQKSPENIIRLPKGPSLGQGFNIRR
ncbi:CLUMA_CG007002, isoform A [Clunio marinus]|uniref:SUZ RNA-binding domain-containing n=1 Tax=Clunio marinus TaxID=568069 RepID=A0A1J1I132_9DIPT|nr:CLUMA_CG007002, isoform A [Clunio marinus]